MIAGNLFRLQLLDFFSSRRLIILRISISLLLSLPFIIVKMPARVQAGGVTMVIIFTSFFSAAVNYTRLDSDSRLERLMLLPTPKWLTWLDLIFSSVISRLIPAVVILSCFIIANSHSFTFSILISISGMILVSLIFLILLGMAAGHLARNNGEVHLYGAIICVFLAIVSGVTPMTERLKPLRQITIWNPLARLLTILTDLANNSVDIKMIELIFALVLLVIFISIAAQRLLSNND